MAHYGGHNMQDYPPGGGVSFIKSKVCIPNNN
jgi:hypothetical protein